MYPWQQQGFFQMDVHQVQIVHGICELTLKCFRGWTLLGLAGAHLHVAAGVHLVVFRDFLQLDKIFPGENFQTN